MSRRTKRSKRKNQGKNKGPSAARHLHRVEETNAKKGGPQPSRPFSKKTDSDAPVSSDPAAEDADSSSNQGVDDLTPTRHSLGCRVSVSETDADSGYENGSNGTSEDSATETDYTALDMPGADPDDNVEPFVVESTAEQIEAARAFFATAKAAETREQGKRARTRSRVFSVMQYREHPETGEVMLTQEQIDEGIEVLGDRLYRWAYIWHPNDRLVEVDDGTGEVVCCGIKGLHMHMVLWVADSDGPRPTIRTVSDAFGIPSARVKPPRELTADTGGNDHKGRGAAEKAFFDLCEYLPHESRGVDAVPGIHQIARHYLVDKTQVGKPGKYQYGRGRIVSNFDFGHELDVHMATRHNAAVDGGGGAKLSKLFQAVNTGAMTLRQVKEAEPALYTAKGTISHLQKLRDDYLLNAPLPSERTNYYIGGAARTGKSTVAVLFARALAQSKFPDLTEDEAIYMVGRPGVAFQHYDGQPILIWDDYRPLSIIEAVGGDVRQRDSIWPVLDIAPKRVAVNKKFGAVTLLNAVNIITGIQPYAEFLNGLAGEYTDKKTGERVEVEDKNQAYGRFPFVAEVAPSTIDFYLNQGFAGGPELYQAFEPIARIRANMKRVIDTLDALPTEEAKEQFRLAAGQQMLGGMVDAHLKLRPAPEPLTVEGALADLAATTTVVGPTELALERALDDEAEAEFAGRDAEERGTAEAQADAERLLEERRIDAAADVLAMRIVSGDLPPIRPGWSAPKRYADDNGVELAVVHRALALSQPKSPGPFAADAGNQPSWSYAIAANR